MDVLLRIKIERNVPVDQDMKDAIANLRLDINSDNLDKLLQLNSFKDYCKMLLSDTSGAQACLMNQYIKDVSSMLALIFPVQEKKFSVVFGCRTRTAPKCFAFNHINYSHYLTFQHVNFSEIKHCNENVWNDLLREEFSGSLSGEPFSVMHRFYYKSYNKP